MFWTRIGRTATESRRRRLIARPFPHPRASHETVCRNWDVHGWYGVLVRGLWMGQGFPPGRECRREGRDMTRGPHCGCRVKGKPRFPLPDSAEYAKRRAWEVPEAPRALLSDPRPDDGKGRKAGPDDRTCVAMGIAVCRGRPHAGGRFAGGCAERVSARAGSCCGR